MAPATVVAAACLAMTGYVCAQAGIDVVTAIGDTRGHRPPPSNGVVSGIKSLVGSPAFAAAMSKASSAAAASHDFGDHCLPATAACVDLTGRVPWPRGEGADGYEPAPLAR